jgi:hypothetical protein
MHQAVTYYRSIERDIFAGNTDEQTMFGKELSQIEAEIMQIEMKI